MTTSTERPNLLILFCDQLRADALGIYGNRVVETPAIDAFAARGVVFESAYTPSPVCVPARSSFITGLEPQNGDCFENFSETAPGPTFMDAATNAGYRTHGIGKMHFTPDITALRGFQSREIGEEFGDAETDDYLRFVAESGYSHVEHPHGLRDEMYYIPQLSPVPEKLHHTTWVADRSIAFLDEQTADQPFLLWSSFIAPHPPFAPPSPWHRRFEPSVMEDPFVPLGSDELRTTYNDLQNRYKYRDGGDDRRLAQLIKAYYYASVSYLDTQIERILGSLEVRGLAENTLVMLTADHGEFLGDYGSYGKRSFLDAAARIPMIVAGPGVRASRDDAGPVSLVDLHATIMAAIGAPDSATDGTDLLTPEPGDRVVYGQYQQAELALYCVIDSGWKYIWSPLDAREYLIDRSRDPRETANLAYNPRRRGELLRMRGLATAHFTELRTTDIESEARNVPIHLGTRASPQAVQSMHSLDRSRDAATLVVRGGPWSPDTAAAAGGEGGR